MEEKQLEKIKRLSWGDIKKNISAKTPFEAISPLGSMLLRIKEYTPIVAVLPYTGHRVREEIASKMSIEDDSRLADEDASLAPLVDAFPIQLFGLDSRYEYDLDRPRTDAIYLKPFQSWGKKVWVNPPSKEEIDVSLQKYDEFYDLVDFLTEEFAKLSPKTLFVTVHGVTPKAGTKISAPYQIDLDLSAIDQTKHGKAIDVFTQELKNASPNLSVNGGNKTAGALAKKLLLTDRALAVSLGVGRPTQELPTPVAVSSALLKGAQASFEIL